jgi:hypothetical protein
MATVSEQIVREAPEIEAYKLGLLKSGKTLADISLQLPTQQVAGLSALENQAIGQTGQAGGIGGYQALAQSGKNTLGTGLGTMGRALGALSYAPKYQDASAGALGRSEQSLGQSTGIYGGGPGYTAQGFNAQQGPAALGYGAGQFQGGQGYTAGQFQGGQGYTAQGFQGGPGYAAGQYGTADLGPQSYTAQSFDPSSVSQYFNPYEDAAVQQALTDIRRQGDIAGNQQNAAAVQAGAFGGSRQGLQSAELGRNVLEQQGRTAAGMRQAGFQNAMQQAQSDFANQQQRQQAQAQFGTQFGQQAFEDAQRRQQAQAQFGTSTSQQAFEEQQRRQQAQAQFGTSTSQQAFEDAQRRQQAQAQFGTSTSQQAFEDAQRRQQAQAQFGSSYGQQTFQNQQQAQQQAFEDQQRRQQAQAQFGTQFGQQAFEDQQRRQQAAAQQQQGIASLYGTLANTQSALAGQYGNIGQSQGNMGVQQLNAAQQAQAQGLSEIQALQQAGGLQRQQSQAALNADFSNQQRQMYEPQTRLSWLSDIYKGAPSSQSSIGSQVAPVAPTPSIFQQAAGLGTGLIGAAAGASTLGKLF